MRLSLLRRSHVPALPALRRRPAPPGRRCRRPGAAVFRRAASAAGPRLAHGREPLLVPLAVSGFGTSFTAVSGHRSHPQPRGERWGWRSRACGGPEPSARSPGSSAGDARRWVITLVQRYLAEGDAGLEARSRRPLTSPRRTPADVKDVAPADALNRGLHPASVRVDAGAGPGLHQVEASSIPSPLAARRPVGSVGQVPVVGVRHRSATWSY